MAALNHSQGDLELDQNSEMVNFINRILEVSIPKDFSSVPSECRLELLNDMIRSFHSRIPFQNIILMSQVASDRRAPTLEEMIEDVLSERGGLCHTNNTFFKVALEALGFRAYHVTASVTRKNTHIITCIQNVAKEGDLYLAEVGCGYPSFRAICLDFDSESPTYKDSFCTYKLVRINSANPNVGYPAFERWQKREGSRPVPPADDRGEDWYRYYHFTSEPRSLAFCRPFAGLVYEATGNHPFQKSIAISSFPGGLAVTLRSVTGDGDGDAKKCRKLVLTQEKTGGGVERADYNLMNESEFRLCLGRVKEMLPRLQVHLADALQNYRDADLT